MGILDGIVEWIATQVMNILDMINTSVLVALGCDMETFLMYFPAAETFYSIIVALAIGLLLLNLVFQLFRNFGVSSSGEAENPVSLTIRTCIFLFLAFFAKDILDIILDIGGTPYAWLMTEDLPPLDFADFNSVLLTVLGASLSGSIALIALILLIILAWNYIRLLFEAAERYVLLGVLVYTAPLAFSMGGSQNTMNIFRSWCRMLGGQILMILMNVWCLRIFTSMFAGFIANPLSLENGNFLIWFLCAVAFLKVSQKIDSFVQMLGINVGRTGSSMLGEAAIAMRTIDRARKVGGSTSSTSSTTNHQETFLQGGLAGAVGRQFSQGAIHNITGKSDSIASNIARSVYNSSIQNGGGFSTNVISSIARGDVTKTGTMKGEEAVQAFSSYMGVNHSSMEQMAHTENMTQKNDTESTGYSGQFSVAGTESNNSQETTFVDMQTSAEQVIAEYQQNIGASTSEYYGNDAVDSSPQMNADTIPFYSENNHQEQSAFQDMGSVSVPYSENESFSSVEPNGVTEVPVYSQIEMGGGRITGVETTHEFSDGRAFAMYDTEKYMPPAKGDYKTVTAADGSKWYHQYAQPTVIKEPFMKEDGKIQYQEHIENKLPEPPKRRDRV